LDCSSSKLIPESLDFAVGAASVPGGRLPPIAAMTSRRSAEEINRIYGIDDVVSVALPRAEGVAAPTASHEQKQETPRAPAAAALWNEAVTWSFPPTAQAEHFASKAVDPRQLIQRKKT
jgi:phenylalanyl-tRNA synthetase beta chain